MRNLAQINRLVRIDMSVEIAGVATNNILVIGACKSIANKSNMKKIRRRHIRFSANTGSAMFLVF